MMLAVLRNFGRKLAKALTLAVRPGFRRGLIFGVGAGIEHEELLNGLNAGTVVDVGANKGQFALLALALFPQAKIYAFEPLAGPFARLTAWGRREDRLICRRLALAQTAGTQVMHVSARADNSSLRAITPRQTAQFPGTERVGEEEVAVARLDEVLCPADLVEPALLKIDVQGGELDVLRGATALLPYFEWVYVECSFVEFYQGQDLIDEVTEFLAQAGFSPTVYWRTCRDAAGAPMQADVLFGKTDPFMSP